jgi:beta-barrel assembly-enhancing protease
VKLAALLLGAVALVGGVAATREAKSLSPTAAGYRLLAEQDLRLATIGYHLARANAPYCKLTAPNPGWVLHDIAQYGDPAAAREAFDFPEPVSVMAVIEGGGAAQAGIGGGEGLRARNGRRWDWAQGKAKRLTTARFNAVRSEMAALLAAPEGISLTLATAQGERTIQLRPVATCASDFWVDVRKKRDAGADGERVRVTSAMIDYVGDDDELAAVVAHELAHNLLEHRKRIDAVKQGRTATIKATEEQADRLSVWLMANAGYDPEAAIAFWTRYGEETGLGIFTAPTHYRWQVRVAMFREEIAAIAAVRGSGRTLDPPLLAAHRAAR